MADRATSFVRSWDTETPVSRSAATLEEMIRRYGASGYTRSEDYANARIVVAFTIAGRDVRVLIDVPTVERKLLAMKEFKAKRDRKPYDSRAAWAREQSARVAWRHLLLYVEASLNAVSAGLLTLEEAFFAHALIATPDGGQQRGVDFVRAVEAHVAATRALPSSTTPLEGAPHE